MKKLIIIAALLAASPAHAVGFGMGLAGYGGALQQLNNPDLYEREEERRYQREALQEQQQQTRIMQQQQLQQQLRRNYQEPTNYYR